MVQARPPTPHSLSGLCTSHVTQLQKGLCCDPLALLVTLVTHCKPSLSPQSWHIGQVRRSLHSILTDSPSSFLLVRVGEGRTQILGASGVIKIEITIESTTCRPYNQLFSFLWVIFCFLILPPHPPLFILFYLFFGGFFNLFCFGLSFGLSFVL